jgi:hypothetical protein
MAETIRPSLFSQITVQHEPAGLLGRVFLLCEAQLRERGVSLAFASMSDLVAVNKANSDSWAPLWSGFDPAFSNLTPDNSFCILGYNRHGDVVTTQAARFLDWPETTYQREAEALRLAYADPDASKLPGEQVKVSALAARGVTGRVVNTGAAWYRKDYRGTGLVSILPRMARALAYTRWATDCSVTMMAEAVVRGNVFPMTGYCNLEWDVRTFNSRGGIPRFAFLWSKRDEMFDDLEEFLRGFDISTDTARRIVDA